VTRHFNLAVYPSEASDHRETKSVADVFSRFFPKRATRRIARSLIGLRLTFLLRPKKKFKTSDSLSRCLSTAS
jgi:hypothetical protein